MKLEDINERSRDILRLVVEGFLQTGEPVGSRTLARAGSVNLSPASIRNVMADLEDYGLLTAPHTSAGRQPTQLGLRLFVDGLLEVGNLSAEERASIEGKVKAENQSFDEVLGDAIASLSGLSRCAGLVLVPKSESAIRHVEFVPLDQQRALVVVVQDNGSVENRVITLPPGIPNDALIRAGNFLSSRFGGMSFEETGQALAQELVKAEAELDSLTQKVVEQGAAVWTGENSASPSLIVRGRSNLLGDISMAEDLERIRSLFDDLESKRDLIKLLESARDADGVRIFIGSENNLFSLSGSSLVVAPYMKGGSHIVGAIGVIGPTRLNYARIIPMVDYTAKLIGRML